jgi:hypothetical protein
LKKKEASQPKGMKDIVLLHIDGLRYGVRAGFGAQSFNLLLKFLKAQRIKFALPVP